MERDEMKRNFKRKIVEEIWREIKRCKDERGEKEQNEVIRRPMKRD
jgi:hypothetical protein